MNPLVHNQRAPRDHPWKPDPTSPCLPLMPRRPLSWHWAPWITIDCASASSLALCSRPWFHEKRRPPLFLCYLPGLTQHLWDHHQGWSQIFLVPSFRACGKVILSYPLEFLRGHVTCSGPWNRSDICYFCLVKHPLLLDRTEVRNYWQRAKRN